MRSRGFEYKADGSIEAHTALGMPKAAGVVQRAVDFFLSPYPRQCDIRNGVLDAHEEAHRDDWNPFEDLDGEFYHLLDLESEGFEVAADKFALENTR
jgi:hypothetical protein